MLCVWGHLTRNADATSGLKATLNSWSESSNLRREIYAPSRVWAVADCSAKALRDLAEVHLAAVLESLPSEPLNRFVMFIEVVRAMDYWGTHVPSPSLTGETVAQSLDLMYWGWNRAVAELFEPLSQPDAFPLMASTPNSRGYAASLMQELGKASLVRRLADMSDGGIMEITRDGDEFQVRMCEDALAQFADATELDRLKAAEARLPSSSAGWTMASMLDALLEPGIPGNYMALANPPEKRWLRHDIEELIKPLVRPWDTGRGVMVAYDARIEVDQHYMAEALAASTRWLDEAGIHPGAMLGSITGADLAAVGASLISLHAKHLGCVSVAKKLFSQVSVAQSLPIWEPRNALEESISIMSDRPERVVQTAFDVLAMTSERAKKLADHSTPLIPLLFDLGNGFILRPVSCLTRNPFVAARTQQQWVDQRAQNAVSLDREEWMREELYGMFGGWRYICFPGNLKLRRGGAILTDIDAAVYDRLTGDVGLFQLKWQDYSTNDVRQLRSKAANLSVELAEWSRKVKSWVEENGVSALNKSLRLKQKRREAVKRTLLFAISRMSVRTQGYGVKNETPCLAMAVWPQFARVRMEIGPTEQSLRDIHARLLQEYVEVPKIHPMSTSIRVADTTIHIHGFWNRTDDDA